MKAIGLMSGTSLDGVDVALLDTDGERIAAFGPSGYRPYRDDERALLRQALTDAVGLTARGARPGVVAEAEGIVTHAHTEAVDAFLRDNGLAAAEIDVIGFHGQTVLHRPERRLTVQLGDGAALAKATGIAVVHDFRAADVAAGGQGAPLVPVYHRALVGGEGLAGPVVVVNIGGVANVTYIDGDTLIACDVGPGNALLDDFVMRHAGMPFDAGGQLAAQGRADEAWVAAALAHPFFASPPPKSLDRNDFAGLTPPGGSAADGAATLTGFTVEAIARIARLLPRPARHWVVAGGGARNTSMMGLMAARLAPARVERADELGWSSDAIEAQAFAFLAVRALRGLPLTYPATTGVPRPLTGGVLARP
jgi:anhydro-N-acetylmuramic acid kinase